MFKDEVKREGSLLRLAYDPERVEALIHRLGRAVEKPAKPKARGLRVLLLGDGRGEEHYLAQRLADALAQRLLCLPVARALRMTEANLRKLLGRAARAKAVLLIEQAEELFDKQGKARPKKTRAGANAERIASTLRRRRGTTLLASDTTGERLVATQAWADLVVTFGERCDGGEAELETPVSRGNFRVRIGDRDCACAEVRGLGLHPSKEDDDPPSVTLARAMGPSSDFFRWRQSVAAGKDERRDIEVHLLDAAGGDTVAAWRLKDARPVAWIGPELNAMANEVAMETLEVRFTRLEWIGIEDDPRSK